VAIRRRIIISLGTAPHADGDAPPQQPRASASPQARPNVAVNGFADDRDYALYRYNNSNQYVQAVNDYAAVLAADPASFGGYYRWDVYYNTTAGDVLLPIGYTGSSPISVVDYLATHPR
jgi:hypothetical protein